jgi:hypothetical protein
MRQALQTAVTRAQERTAEEVKNREASAVRETLLAEEKRLGQERQFVEKERLRLEEERKQQAQLLEQQLKTAETERIKAEQRAAAAEKQLSEKQSSAISDGDKKSSATSAKSAGNSVQKSANADAAAKTDKPKTAFNDASNLFAEPVPDAKSSWLMPAIVVVLLLLGGVGAGVWMMRSSNVAAESKQPVTNQTTLASDKPLSPEPVIETPQPTIEQVSTTDPRHEPSTTTVASEKSVNQPGFKNKSAPPPAKIQKPAATTRTTANQKKAVTVDDLIGGN